MYIVYAERLNGDRLYWTGFDLSAHRGDAKMYSLPQYVQKACARASRHYPLLSFISEEK